MVTEKNKSKIWDEISGMVHLGRSASDIEEALSSLEYDSKTLKEVLTGPLIEQLLQKEHHFVMIQEAKAADRTSKAVNLNSIKSWKKSTTKKFV